MRSLGSLKPTYGAGDEEHEHENAAIEEPFDGDRAEGAHLGDVFAVAEDVGADDLAGARGEEVVGHVADDGVGEEAGGTHFGDRPHEDRPANAACGDGAEEDGEGRDEVPVVGLFEGVLDLDRVGGAKK